MSRVYRIYKEHLKFYILILLLITSVVQLGILWGYQNQGLPFNFMYPFASKEVAVNNALSLQNFFAPYQVVVSEGSDGSRWILNKNDANYKDLWEEAKYYLSSAIKVKSDKSDYDLKKDWYNLVDKKAFVFEFKANIKLGFLKDFFNISETSSDSPSGIFKMIISPWDDTTNFNSNTIYINDGAKIYKYNLLLNPNDKFNDKSKYEEIITELSNNSNIKTYGFVKSARGDSLEELGINEDLMGVLDSKYFKYNSIEASVLLGFGSKEPDIDRIKSKILGSEKDNYDYIIDETDKSIELKTLNNIYKIYTNGFMEYNYLPVQSTSDKGEFKDAFKNAIDFVTGLDLETDNTKLFLSGYSEDNPKYYEFDFDYIITDKINEVPIYMNYSYKDLDGKPLKLHNSIIIKCNSKNVLSCGAMIKTFRITGHPVEYGIGTNDATYFRNSGLKADKKAGKDVSISYEIGNEEENKNLKLLWVVKSGDNYYTSPVKSK